jgi:hypothetical protein
VAVIGSVVSSVYLHHIDDLAGPFGLSGTALTTARESLGGALQIGQGLGSAGDSFTTAVKDSFVDALSVGLRLSTIVILVAAFVAWRFLPARAHDPLADDAHDDPAADVAIASAAVGGD